MPVTCSFFDRHRPVPWGAVARLLLIALLVGEMTRQPSFAWRFLLPSTVSPFPIEEGEQEVNEIVLATPRQRTRCRLERRSLPLPSALACQVPWSHGIRTSMQFRHAADTCRVAERGLPLRC